MARLLQFFAGVFLLIGILSMTMYSLPAHRPTSLLYADMVPASYRAEFVQEVLLMSERLHLKPEWLMVVMRFETGGTFRANVKNRYSGAVGLIQFIPSTARSLGTTTGALGAMSAVHQLHYVEKYFSPYAGRMSSVYDVYIVVFAPAFLGRPKRQVLYRANSLTQLGRNRYRWNRVLDENNDGVITIRDVHRQIRKFVPADGS